MPVSSDPDLADRANLNSSPNTNPPSSLLPTVRDRLNTSLQNESSPIGSNHQQQILAERKYHLRHWRIQNGYTRQKLAEKLNLDVNQLLCIESSIGLSTDIASSQLCTLALGCSKILNPSDKVPE